METLLNINIVVIFFSLSVMLSSFNNNERSNKSQSKAPYVQQQVWVPHKVRTMYSPPTSPSKHHDSFAAVEHLRIVT